MTCNDCIHNDVCEVIKGRPHRVGINALRVSEKRCPYHSFKDKSRFIELPCKVGDTVYAIVNQHYLRCASIASIPFCIPLYNGYGETVFLTREDAERKLEEMRQYEDKSRI